jgi:hypothetical protein
LTSNYQLLKKVFLEGVVTIINRPPAIGGPVVTMGRQKKGTASETSKLFHPVPDNLLQGAAKR